MYFAILTQCSSVAILIQLIVAPTLTDFLGVLVKPCFGNKFKSKTRGAKRETKTQLVKRKLKLFKFVFSFHELATTTRNEHTLVK